MRENNPLVPIVAYVEGLEQSNEDQEKTIADLKKQLSDQATILGKTQAQVDNQAEQIASLNTRIDQLSNFVDRNILVGRVIGAALAMMERRIPYIFGGTIDNADPNKRGFDCSALVQYSFKIGANIAIPRVSKDQATKGLAIAEKDLQPGDGLYFDPDKDGTISHCGIYVGNGKMIHTANKTEGIALIDYSPRYKLVTARRFF